MGRKNSMSAHRRQKLAIAKGHHFLYQPTEDSRDDQVVRYLGEQDGDHLTCYMPGGYALPIHVSQLANVPRRVKLRAA